MTSVRELQEKSEKLRAFFDQYLPYDRPAPVLKDFVKVQHELMWGGVWQTNDLDLKLKSYATIAAQCVNGYDFGIEHQVRTGLTIGITPIEIKEIFIQLLFYAGIPATVFGLLVAQQVINERDEWTKADIEIDWDWLPSVQAKLERGDSFIVDNWGGKASGEIKKSLSRRLTPEASEIVDSYNFGEIWVRPILSLKERLVCVLAALMSRGHWSQLRNYIEYGLKSDLSQSEICGIFVQAGWYRGWPHVEDALAVANEVFNLDSER